MAKHYDVVIVGAGPTGLLAAKTAGESGLSIALLEMRAGPSSFPIPLHSVPDINSAMH